MCPESELVKNGLLDVADALSAIRWRANWLARYVASGGTFTDTVLTRFLTLPRDLERR